MLPKPKHLGPQYGAAFTDRSVADAYPNRPPYPEELLSLLRDLIVDTPRTVLELGCGTGEISRALAPEVDRVDAVDQSEAMRDVGKALPGGDHPKLRWVHSSAEEFDFSGDYALVVAAESIHWMDWEVVFPRMRDGLSDNARLAIVHNRSHRAAWDSRTLGGLAQRYSTNKDFVRWDLFEELGKRGLFDVERRLTTRPVWFEQSVDDYLSFWHSMASFSRERMAAEAVERFDEEARRLLAPHAKDGALRYEVTVDVAWGRPRAPTAG